MGARSFRFICRNGEPFRIVNLTAVSKGDIDGFVCRG